MARVTLHERRRTMARVTLLGVAFAAAIGVFAWFELSLWNECRVDHSWFYCWRVLS